jgi:PAS domain S-box-containing protein
VLRELQDAFKNSPVNVLEGDRIQGVFYLVFCVVAVGLAGQAVFADEPESVLGSTVFGLAVLLSWLAGRAGYPLTSRSLLPTVALLVTFSLAWQSHGIHDLSVVFFPIVVIFSGLLLGAGASLIFAALCSIAGAVLVWGDMTGRIDSPAGETTGIPDAIVLMILLALSAALMRFVILSLNRTLETLRTSQAALADSNRSLETRASELRSSEARWRSLVESAPDQILTVAPNGAILLTNVPMTSVSDGPQASVYDLIAEESWPALRSAMEQVFSESSAASCELQGAEGDRWLSVSLGPIETGGDAAGATLILSDITERVEADAERRMLETQLNEAQRMEALGQLAGGIAHDFNNLLTVIGGNASLLEDDVASALGRESLSEIQASQERAAALVRQLLAFGRRQMLRPQVLDLRAQLSDIEGMLRRLVGEHVEFSFLAHDRAAPVLADPGQVEQVVVNLALNARDAMPTGGRLELRLWSHRSDAPSDVGGTIVPPGRYTVMSFADDGAGMDEATRARVFQPFFSTKPIEKGTGLGLSSAYGIISQSGGYIAVESEPMQGATFHVYLPETDAIPVAATESVDRQTAAIGSETILVVEDAAAMRRLLKRILEGSGYRVLLAEDGTKALELAERCDSIDLILSDLIMPGMDGKAFTDEFQQRYGPTRVIYMSGYADDYLAPHRVLDDSVNFIQKPFGSEDLLALIRNALDSPRED